MYYDTHAYSYRYVKQLHMYDTKYTLLFQIQVGVIENNRIVRGSRQVVTVEKNADVSALLSAACARHAAYNRHFDGTNTWKLKYPDGSEVVTLPGSAEPFRLIRYREELMRDYQRIVLYISQGKFGYVMECRSIHSLCHSVN